MARDLSKLPILRTSERTTWRECPQKWWWGYREGLVPQGAPNYNLWFGTGIHLALASHYQKGTRRGKGAKGPVAVWQKYCKDEYVPMKVMEGDDSEFVESMELGTVMLEGYLKEYGNDDHMYILATEQSRKILVHDHDGTPLFWYAYTMDGVYRDRADHNRLKLLEHKTALIVSLSHLPLDDQAGAYPTFETELLRADGTLRPDEKILDVTYNILRKGKPRIDDRPRNAEGKALNKDGTVSKNQNTQAKLFVREDISRSDESRLRIVDRAIIEVHEMNRMRADRDLIYKNPHSGPFGCGSCPFLDMCILHEEGGDWQDLRDWKFKARDPYTDHRKAA